MPFVVQVLNKTAEVMVMGMAAELPLSYADGMIGCMPVFETKEQAESFADGVYEILEIVTAPPKGAGESPAPTGAGESPAPTGAGELRRTRRSSADLFDAFGG